MTLHIYIGWDSREADVSDVCAHSIRRRTQADVKFHYLRHRQLRKMGYFRRPWLVRNDDGENIDLVDNKPFSTEFSHTRFLVPSLMGFKGRALFLDADMLCLSDINKLFQMGQDQYAVQCVKHQHHPVANVQKMDGRLQLQYYRKNWSSFVLWNCAHEANRGLTPDKINTLAGGDLHAFKWLKDDDIGALPTTYNFISGVSPHIPFDGKKEKLPDVIHYTEGGPWFDGCKDVPFSDLWEREHAHWLDDGAVKYG